jgi:hypothetical protein
MLYFWFIPVLLILLLALVYFFNRGTRRARGSSRLERAGRETGRPDLP